MAKKVELFAITESILSCPIPDVFGKKTDMKQTVPERNGLGHAL
jgi:hypothetical protein